MTAAPENPRRIVVGTMCHCDDPDNCYDHWEFFANPAGYAAESGHVARGGALTVDEMRSMAKMWEAARA